MVLACFANGLGLLFVVWAAAHMMRERKARKRRTGELRISPLAGLAAGAMFLGLQAIVQPQVQHMIVEELKEKSVDDESGEPPLGGRAFHRQLRRIRNGEEVNELVLVAGGPGPEGRDKTE